MNDERREGHSRLVVRDGKIVPEKDYQDILYARTTTHFCFLDRLKLLIGYTLEVTTATKTQFVVGGTLNEKTTTLLLKPSWFPVFRARDGYQLENKENS
jgi:hypothetical protein